MIWAYLKSYHDNHSKYKEKVNWLLPLQDVSEINKFLSNPSNIHVLGLSNYMWNSQFNMKLAEEIKKINPNCLIVCGGPEFDTNNKENFKNIDIYVPVEGEVTFSKILDCLVSNQSWKEVGGIVYLEDNTIKRNPALPYINDWFFSPLLENKEYFEGLIKKNKENSIETLLQFETTRGCPYSCTFCDWGGGIHTKVRSRPLEILKEEITWTGKNKIQKYFITDANFGFMKRDIDIAKHIVETKKKYNWPKSIVYQSAKNQTDRIIEVADILYKGSLTSSHMITVQSTDNHVLSNIERSNLPTSKQKFISAELNKRQVPVKSQIILGLPGDTLDKLKNTVNDLYEMGVSREIEYFVFGLFPNAPANDPIYKEKYKLKTIQGYAPVYCRNLTTLEGYDGRDLQICSGVINLNRESERKEYIWDMSNSLSEFVVSSYSYSKKEWAEMYTWINVLNGMVHDGLFKNIADFYNYYGISYKEFFHYVIESFKIDKEFDDLYKYIIDQSFEFSTGSKLYEEMTIPGSKKNVAFESSLFVASWFAKHKEKIKNIFIPIIYEKFGHKETIKDLANYGISSSVGFDLIEEKILTFSYDWSKILREKNFSNIVPTNTTYIFKNDYIRNFKKLNKNIDLYYYTLCLIYGRWRKKMNYNISYKLD
jgi:radical SAM superfamily enzyme YgiQ (UPF0313 family)